MQNLNATAVAVRDIHGLDFYLENPEVHVPLFRSWMYPEAISAAELKLQDDTFNSANAKDDLTNVRKYLSSLDFGANPAWSQILQMIFAFRANPMGLVSAAT